MSSKKTPRRSTSSERDPTKRRKRRSRTESGENEPFQPNPTSTERPRRKKRTRKNNAEVNDTSRQSSRRKNKKPVAMRSKAKRSTFTPVEPKEPILDRVKKWFDVSSEPDILDSNLRQNAHTRLKIGAGLLALGLCALVARAGYLMLWPNKMLEEATLTQYQDVEMIRGRRGDIVDRNGRLLATSVALQDVVLSPIHIPLEHLDLVVEVLTKHLHLDPENTKSRILKKREHQSQYLVIAKAVTPLAYTSLKNEIKEIYKGGDKAFRKSFADVKNRGIHHEDNTYRYYTGKSDAAPLLGGFSQYSHRGVGGLEQQYDSVLRGAEFATIRIRDGRNQDLAPPDEMAPQAQDGKNLVLTLDRRIQHVTDLAIAKAVETAKAKSGFAVVVDVKTGEILASSTQPTANINDNSVFQNGMLTHHGFVDSYEAGSVLKPLVVASAINEGLFTPDTLIDCNNGYWRIHGASIRDDHPKSILSVTEVIKYSSNIGAAKVALELGKENTIDYLRKFGLGQETGLGFPAEPRGILRSASKVKPIELITMSYGYGLTTTLTQLAMAYAALGNEGKLMKPMLVKEITNANGEVMERFEPTELDQVVAPHVAKQMLTMMETVVDDGTAKKAQTPGYRVAGKTGTAKKAALGGYSDTDRIGSFVGLVPADNPRLAIAISVDTPTEGLAYGGVVAAPAFSEIAAESMRILGIEPTEPISTKTLTSQTDDSSESLVVRPPAEIIWTEKGEIIVPNLTGLTLRDALSTLQIANLNLRFKGSGRVVEQYPAAGTHIAPNEEFEILLQ